jgi:poly-beta-1,6-N-acetyl-D-glucosamine N-deacetylase
MGDVPQRSVLSPPIHGTHARGGRVGAVLSVLTLTLALLAPAGAAGRRTRSASESKTPSSASSPGQASEHKDGGPGDSTGSLPVPTVAILCYHDLSDDPGSRDAVPADSLRAHIRRAKAGGWTFLRLSDLIAARAHPESLPARTMVLTFDDGYRSFLTRALPILREERVPSTLAVVSDFVENPPEQAPPVLSWAEIVQIDHSGDVEIASHSHALHSWIRSDPQGDTSPSATTRRYLASEDRYEDRGEYVERIRRDMQQSREILRSWLGHGVDAYVWPYGEYNQVAQGTAIAAGFTITLALGDRCVSAQDLKSGVFPRYMVQRGQPIGGPDQAWLVPPRTPMLAIQADLDSVWAPETEAFERNVEGLIAQARRVGATHVFLQACPDPRGDGFLRETWFMNHQAPVRADVWTFVTNRLRRADLEVWVRAPSMNLSWAWEEHPDWRIPFRGSRRGTTPWYFRISPDLDEASEAALDFYADLAVYLPVDGIVFDDDAYMLPGERLRSGDSTPEAKAQAIQEHLEAIKTVVRAWRPECKFGRKLYAPAVERAGVHPLFAQDLEGTLRDGDLAVVMAYANTEGHARDAARWAGTLARLAVRRTQARPGAGPAGRDGRTEASIMFQLQAYDWEQDSWIPAATLLDVARAARAEGIVQFGVTPVLPNDGELPTDLLRPPLPVSAKGRAKPSRRHIAGAP